MTSNWMELGLTREQDEFVRIYADRYKNVYIDTIDTVFGIAKAIEILREAHANSGVQGSYADALTMYGFTARDGGPMNKAIRSHLKTLLENEAKVREWWGKVPERKKRDWLSAKAIYTNWKASLKPPVDPDAHKRPTPLQQVRATNIELQEQLHAANERAKATKPSDDAALATARARIAELEREVDRLAAENAAWKSYDSWHTAAPTQSKPLTREELAKYAPPLPKTLPTWEQQKAARAAAAARPEAKLAVVTEKLQQAQARIGKLQAENALQEEIAKRDRQIKGLQTQIKNLQATIAYHNTYHHGFELTRAMHKLIRSCLHPDREIDPTLKKRYVSAFQVFSQIKFIDETNAKWDGKEWSERGKPK
jgi:hypothetical protein